MFTEGKKKKTTPSQWGEGNKSQMILFLIVFANG